MHYRNMSAIAASATKVAHPAAAPQTRAMTDTRDFWETFYNERPSVWSGRPNAVLVDEVGDLRPGRAADLGCGEGGDALWLAARGWSVTALDVSHTAIERGRIHARDAGLADDAITWQQQDLTEWMPHDTFDLVSACFLQSPIELPIGGILQTALGAVAPGGTLLVVQHAAVPGHHADLPTRDEMLAAIDADPHDFTVLIAEERTRTGEHRGELVSLTDLVVRITRNP